MVSFICISGLPIHELFEFKQLTRFSLSYVLDLYFTRSQEVLKREYRARGCTRGQSSNQLPVIVNSNQSVIVEISNLD